MSHHLFDCDDMCNGDWCDCSCHYEAGKWRWVYVPFEDIQFHPQTGQKLDFLGRLYWWARITYDFSR